MFLQNIHVHWLNTYEMVVVAAVTLFWSNGSIYQNIAAPVDVLTVSASDADVGDNGVVRYHLRVGDSNVQETDNFKIHPETGLLQTKLPLDREDTAKYEVRLIISYLCVPYDLYGFDMI